MKVYLYNPDNGVYLGEDFSAGETVADASWETTVVPPPYRKGEVPVFDRTALQWRLVGAGQRQTLDGL